MLSKELLKDVGFSESEALVYLALIKLGKSKSGKIISQTGLQSSVVYNAIQGLIQKGFIAYTREGQIKHYLIHNPKLLISHLEAKKIELEKELPSLSFEKGQMATSEVYEGYKGLYAATLAMIDNKPKKTEYKYFSANSELLTEEALNFFSKVDMIKKEKGLVVKGIAEEKSQSNLLNYKSSGIRYTKLPIPSAMNICGDKVLLISFSEKPIGVLIHSKEIASQYHQLWDSVWKHSSK